MNLIHSTPFLYMTNPSNEDMVQDFLMLDSKQQMKKIQSESLFVQLKEAIQKADQTKIREEKDGNNLFVQLMHSKEKEIRNLSLICLENGAEINSSNLRGITGLHYAALWGDEALIKTFLEYGAKQTKTNTQSTSTPISLALQNKHVSSALLLASSHSELTPESYLDLFLGRTDIKDILKLLEQFSKKTNLDPYSDQIWAYLYNRIFDFMQYENSSSDYRAIILWLLEHGVISPNLKIHYEVITWLVKTMDPNLNGNYDMHILESLVKHDLLHTIIINNDQWLIFHIREKIRNKDDTENLKNDIEKWLNDKCYMDLYELALDFNKSTEFETYLNIYNAIEKKFNELKDKKFKNIEFLETNFKNQYSRISIVKEFRRIFTALENDQEIGDCSEFAYTNLVKIIIKENKWDWLPKLQEAKNCTFLKNKNKNNYKDIVIKSSSNIGYYKDYDLNKVAFHLMMDKLQPKGKKYTGYHQGNTALALLNTMESLQSTLQISNFEWKVQIDQISRHLKPLIQQCLKFLELIVSSSDQDVAGNVINALKTLKENESFLVPTGVIAHGTCLLVTKVKEKTFRLTDYNTGFGLTDNHYCWQQSRQYQTFDIIDDIPEESIMNTCGWELLFHLRSEKSMNDLYKCISNTIGKGGTKVTPSEYEEDYEAIQMSGTCAMQSLMAMVRHQVMLQVDGSPSEKEAVYKILKFSIFTQFNKDNYNKLDQFIQSYLATVINKLSAETKLAAVSIDDKSFTEALKALTMLIEEFGEKETSEHLQKRNASSTLFRYATLRHASKLLSVLWLKKTDSLSLINAKENEYLCLALAKFEHYSATIENVKYHLEKKERKNLDEKFFSMLFRTSLKVNLHEFCINKMSKLCKENMSFAKKILDHFHLKHEQNDLFIQKIRHHLTKNNESNLATEIETYWKELK